MDSSKKSKKKLINELEKLRKEKAELEKLLKQSKEKEKELLLDKALLESFMESVPVSVYFKDKEGAILKVNKFYLEQKGSPPVN